MDLKDIFNGKELNLEGFNEAVKAKGWKLADLSSGEYVDKEKFDKSEMKRKQADDSLKELNEKVKKFEGVDVDALKKSLSDQQASYEKAIKDKETEFNTQLAATKKKSAIDAYLSTNNVQDVKAIMPYLDESIIKLDGDKLVGIDEQVKTLKESKGFLFKEHTDEGGVRMKTSLPHTEGVGTGDPMSDAFMKGAGIKTTQT
jgi:hypothetical protein